jgi:DNA-binding transcriptional ArsR family regulator
LYLVEFKQNKFYKLGGKGGGMQIKLALWRSCRTIACETRLQLLWLLFREKELCVSAVADCVHMGNAQVSLQLHALNERGLICFRREKMKVCYRPEANELVAFAPQLLEGLRQCYERQMAHATVIRQATALTHERRIEVVRALDRTAMSWNDLAAETGMSDSSLFLHLGKLEARGFVIKTGNAWQLTRPQNRFGAHLLRIALS